MSPEYFCHAGLDINVCPISVKTDVGQIDLEPQLSNRQANKINRSRFVYSVSFSYTTIPWKRQCLSHLHGSMISPDLKKYAFTTSG